MNRREEDQLYSVDMKQVIEKRFPLAVVLNAYTGDWNLGSSRTEIRFAVDDGMPYVEAVISHVYEDNCPTDHSPPWSRHIFLDCVEKHTLRELRDVLNRVLGE